MSSGIRRHLGGAFRFLHILDVAVRGEEAPLQDWVLLEAPLSNGVHELGGDEEADTS